MACSRSHSFRMAYYNIVRHTNYRIVRDTMSSMEDDTTLIWLRPEPSGRRPRFTREQIARAALRIADDESFEAVTMKRIASELGAGTMTLYYYVRTKADIVA